MSNFGGRLSQPKKIKLFLGISFFCQHNSTGGGFLILKQIIQRQKIKLFDFERKIQREWTLCE
jgi:hypothetical protein